MCYYNECKVTRAEFIRLMAIEKELKNLQLNRQAQSGFDYRDWPILVPVDGGNDFEIKNVHWEYIPAFIHDETDLAEARKMNTWLNAKSENLLINDKGKASMYRQGALQGRCLVLSSGFYEWRHIAKMGKKGKPIKATEAIPYRITLKGRPEYFFMAGVSRVWTNQGRGASALTFAIVTTEANDLMKRIHNKKQRMPTILPAALAAEWIQDGLSEKRIKEIASFQLPAEQMEAWTVARDFIKTPDPSKEVAYSEIPPLYE
jgi:putative SOS response-associated peptidase YedK